MQLKKSVVFTLACVLLGVGSLLYASWPLGFVLDPSVMRSGLASELGAYGRPYNWFFIWSDILNGVFVLAGVLALFTIKKPNRPQRLSLILLAVYGVCGAIDAALPLSCLPSLQVCGPVFHDPILIAHGVVDFAGSLSLIGSLVAAGYYVYVFNRRWLPWIWTIGLGGTLFAAASAILYVLHGPGYWAQRYYITLSSVWVVSVPFVLFKNPLGLLGNVSSSKTNVRHRHGK